MQDISRQQDFQRLWVMMTFFYKAKQSLSSHVLVSPFIACHLKGTISSLLQVINRWHLPSQRLAVWIIDQLVDEYPKETLCFVSMLCSELIRMLIFYMRKVTPDVSQSDDAEIEEFKLRSIIPLCSKVSKLNPTAWCSLVQSIKDQYLYLQSVSISDRPQDEEEDAHNNTDSLRFIWEAVVSPLVQHPSFVDER